MQPNVHCQQLLAGVRKRKHLLPWRGPTCCMILPRPPPSGPRSRRSRQKVNYAFNDYDETLRSGEARQRGRAGAAHTCQRACLPMPAFMPG